MSEKITERKCQGCQKIQDRSLMLKITRHYKTGKIHINPASDVTGRSVYVCKNEQCIKILLKKKRIEKNFKDNPFSLSELKASLEGTLHQ